ncbi:MAG TPA: PadR family transcriptional regulator [Moraxellaceae bacterium]|nr:PadR family transcriptional regulator [Moraxellaceae bacterium]
MSLRFAILTLLESDPGSGYDLMRHFKAGIGHFWNASHQQVYQELGKLHSEGLVEFEVEHQSERPDRKVYRLTGPGQSALAEWRLQPVRPPKVNDALLVKVYGGLNVPPAQLLAELEEHAVLHRERLEEYRASEARFLAMTAEERVPYRLPYLTLRRGILYEQDWLRWLDEARVELEQMASGLQ